MNKTELIAVIAKKTDLPKTGAQRALDALIETVTNELSKKEKVVIPGFGTFETSERAARVGRNPQNGAEIQIAAATLPRFKAGSNLKSACNS